MNPTTIMLAEDHHVVRQALRVLLESEPEFSVVGEAADGLEAVGLVERLKPDVLVVDVMLPGLNGLDVTRQMRQRSARTRVIVLSMYANEAYVWEALKNGAAGYVLKDATATVLVHAIREAAAGRRYLSPPLSEEAIEVYGQRARGAPFDPYDLLTARERVVLHLSAEGHSSTQIGARLGISSRTVESHRANLARKLRFRSQADLIRYALQRGIVPALVAFALYLPF